MTDWSGSPVTGPAVSGALPLSGLRVVEIGTMVAGPYSGAILSDLGAEVIKVESPGGDTLRRSVAFAGTEHWFTECNRGKLSLSLDLSTGRGQEILWQLVARSDAVVCNLRPDTLPKLGLSYSQLRDVNPRIVMVQVSAFGSDGPWGRRRGTAPTIDGSSGISLINGDAGTGPLKPPNLFGDLTAAFFAALGVVAAVRAARITGTGECLDVAMTECVSHLLGESVTRELLLGKTDQPHGNVDDFDAPHGCYPCAEPDSWIAIAIESDADWDRLTSLAGAVAWAGDPDYADLASRHVHRAGLDRDLAQWTRSQNAEELMTVLQNAGVACGVVSPPQRVAADPQLAERHFFGDIAGAPGSTYSIVRFPGRPDLTARARTPAPQLAENTDEILGDLLELPPAEVASLHAERICMSPETPA
jgi:crotonobetainyl-CoA:carnitine CoA-transferase CaiB-like acyl-CoA transferase